MTTELLAISDTNDTKISLRDRLFNTRRLSVDLTDHLSAEDMVVQVMEDASPTKWHLAHVTWFFESFVLTRFQPGYEVFDERFNFCFNSYYESQGTRQPRGRRGMLTRPSIYDVFSYRSYVDEALDALLNQSAEIPPDAARLIEIGINHEQQHQELLLTDILALLAANPLRPAYRPRKPALVTTEAVSPLGWVPYDGGIFGFGHAGPGYSWDNENPRHDALLQPFSLADRLVTNGEWLEFIADGGYQTAAHWLADGWAMVRSHAWQAPLYWEDHGSRWFEMTLEGLVPVEKAAPVCHVSFYEADAFARWSGRRLPTEFEWEVAGASALVQGNRTGALRTRPAGAVTPGIPRQMFGDVWQWTQSSYAPYPGYRPPAGAIGEYNGKFMVNQLVLRGASCLTPRSHARLTYRNFFPAPARWQMTGLRLARD